MKRRSEAVGAAIVKAVGVLIVAAVYLAVAVGCLLIPWALRGDELERKAGWLPVEAKIVRVEERPLYQTATYELAHVTFSADGEPVRTTVPNNGERPAGDEIPLIYNPADPTEIRTTPDCSLTCPSFESVFFVMLWVGLAGAIFIAGLATVREML